MKHHQSPHLLYADEEGQVYEHPDLLMVVRRGRDWALPRKDELIPLPPESTLFFLPARRAIGFDPRSGKMVTTPYRAVAAFVCPGYTVSALCAYFTEENAPALPLFAYGAAGFMKGRLWVCAREVDKDQRQVFRNISNKKIKRGVERLLRLYPNNRLISHLAKCALTYCCPAARNLALGRYEAPIPTSRHCNARCVGCISLQPKDSGFPSTQDRISFTPSPREIVQLMGEHARQEGRPIFSFGQGCEGEPLLEYRTIGEAIHLYRKGGGRGTININTNGSISSAVEYLHLCGLSSLRISINSANPALYKAYYRPQGYEFSQVKETMRLAKSTGLFVSINLLFFPGITDTESEFEYLCGLIEETHLDLIQLRNLNIDPEVYLKIASPLVNSPSMGLYNFLRRLKKNFPWLSFGYFNPYLG